MTGVLATVAVSVYVPAALAKFEVEGLPVAPGPSMESIGVAPARSGQSNYVSGYPKEETHCYDFHSHFRVAGSNKYYS